jgi:uncharacterized protein (TIGR02145 family)
LTGGTITGGQNTKSITVLWNSPGNQTVEVNYANSYRCSASDYQVLPVTVHQSPSPSVLGNNVVCLNSIQTYTTEQNMTNYQWAVTGGTIIGKVDTAKVNVQWTSLGIQTISLNYVDANGCTLLNPVTRNVTVNPLPAPTITGNTAVCNNSTGNIYTTETGMTAYTWVVTGGIITAGGTATDNTATVTWNTVGTESISVNYNDANGCTAANPTVHNVLVTPLPDVIANPPTLAICSGFTADILLTSSVPSTTFAWNVPVLPPGVTMTVTSGTGDIHQIINNANTTPAVVNFSIMPTAGGCSALSPTIYPVTMNPLPIPTVSGPTSVCFNSTQTYTTEGSMTGYSWTVSGGTIVSGPTTNTINVHWTSAGPQTITINYLNQYVCTAVNSTSYNVTVNPLPVPTISGSNNVCNQSTGNVYATETGMTAYTWVITGGIITAGGTATDNTATVTWNTVGTESISVNYNDANGCTAASPTVTNVTVKPLPDVIASPPTLSICSGFMANITFTSSVPSTTFAWNVPVLPPGVTMTVTSGTGDIHQIINNANTTPAIVNFSIMPTASGCSALSPTIYPVTVNPLPIPTVSGTQSVCFNSTHAYSTEASMTGYSWTVSGGTIVSGPTTNTINVHWTSAGLQTITVNYLNQYGCTAVNPTSYNVTVNALPVPVISGPAAMCLNHSGTYTVQAGMTGYTWTVTGGTITSGGTPTDNTATVLWNTLGLDNISVNYTDGNGCTAASPTVYNVQVNTLPVPTITGLAAVCVGLTSTYTTEAGMSSYTWDVSAGGTITAGAGTQTITVLWNTVGAQTVDVNYVVGTGCTAASPTVKNITINPLPTPAISGPAAMCLNKTAAYSTEAGKTGYTWSVAGGTIISGTGTATVQITWTTLGNQNVSVNYVDANGCTAVSPTVYNVLINNLPVPTITGSAAICVGQSTTYTTESGMSLYLWNVSAGGTITAGSGTNVITVLWQTVGAQTVSVNYTVVTGCTAVSPTVKAVAVNSLPTPVITGPQQVCANQAANVYSTPNVANHDYVWSVTGDLSFTGNHTNSITVNWGSGPTGSVQVNEIDQSQPTNCNTLTPLYNVTINPNPSPVITGPATPCGQTLCTYTVGTAQANHAYLWTVTGGTPLSGTNSSINVTWGNTNPVTLGMQESITYAPGVVCTTIAPAFPITLVLIPDAAGAISGPSAVCQSWARTYTVAPINNSDSYTWWYVPSAGVTITNNGASANLAFDLTSASGNLYVKGNKSGCASGPTSPPYPITVHTPPYVSLTACNDAITTSTSRPFTLKGGVPPGGQYFVDGNAVSGGIFDPSTLSTTTHLVTYTFTDHNTCVSTSTSVPITIVPGSAPGSCPITFTDPRDNKTYRAVNMGSHCWMLDNLSYGNALTPLTLEQRDNCTPEKYCLTTDPACSTYGGLYQWDELMQYQVPASGQYLQGLCPPEWHVPTQTEWQLLIDGQTNPGNGIAGGDLKDPSPAFGFKALLDGIYYQNTIWAFTSGTPLTTMFWTSSDSGATKALSRGLNNNDPSVSRYVSGRSNAFPVRCVKD